jgi:hypothetical protein
MYKYNLVIDSIYITSIDDNLIYINTCTGMVTMLLQLTTAN